MKKQASILGCGWLGLPLAKHLIKEGWKVKGSTTSASKLAVLNSEEIIAFLIQLQEDKLIGEIQEFLKDSELLLINIPPGLRKNPNSNFVSKLDKVVDAVSKSDIKKIIYVSSTGVFQDHESIPTFTEHYQFTSTEIEASQLVQAEHLLQNLKHIQTTIVRFSGLVGKDRHPVKFLSGKTGLKNPKAPVNLIHLENCIQLISKIIQKEKFGHIFHGNEDTKLSKEVYYTQKAKEFDLKAPQFEDKLPSKGKHISMDWTTKELGINISKMV